MGNKKRSHHTEARDEGDLPDRADHERSGSDGEPEDLRVKGAAKTKARNERQVAKARAAAEQAEGDRAVRHGPTGR